VSVEAVPGALAGLLRPVAIGRRQIPVAEVVDTWVIEDEWWRAPIARQYVRALLVDGRLLTLFHDRAGGGWYQQRYQPSAISYQPPRRADG
jgi:hypothetical protein